MNGDTRKIRVFIAGPFFDQEQVARIQRLENALSRNPQVAEFYSARFHQNQQYPWGSKEWRKVVFNLDLYALRRADVVVAIHDYEGKSTDSGTAFELGYAYAYQKVIILIKEKESVPNLMLIESLHAFFTNVDSMATYDFIRMPAQPYEGPFI
ncbi:Nucleoside 2-deoxyribosyltransferase [Fictibacillus enclensis]|uniref:Nucleoside 2-deoxyribosyltransferase n=1 Tax=Fictibacillus enclensis TaxID=1017270 RepID=A0A0V8J8P3_9BACL|nr:nucleoside 2-deoxyribosyltransferase [Fictibacillus enclensis]KSU83503.1 nucleoside 2-deoxyribosyltransferase [Fictibacillus enclensis]SCC16534.1 Nucleoside 2-deoxyribosyltransferase [Fictibacillus enclensis]